MVVNLSFLVSMIPNKVASTSYFAFANSAVGRGGKVAPRVVHLTYRPGSTKTKKKPQKILLAGKGKGTLKPGRHINVGGQPLADLHLTLAQKFGIEDEHFNEAGTMTIQDLG